MKLTSEEHSFLTNKEQEQGKKYAHSFRKKSRDIGFLKRTNEEQGMGKSIPEAVDEVLSWWWKLTLYDPRQSAIRHIVRSGKLKAMDAQGLRDLVEVVNMVLHVHEEADMVAYSCHCGAEWETRERPQGCPLCRAPNCDLTPRP